MSLKLSKFVKKTPEICIKLPRTRKFDKSKRYHRAKELVTRNV